MVKIAELLPESWRKVLASEFEKPYFIKLEHFLEPVFADSNNYLLNNGILKKSLDHTTEWLLMAVSVGVSIIAIFIALNKFSRYRKTDTTESGFGKILQNKWYVDELYRAIITKPLGRLSLFFDNILERRGIDALVNGTGKAVNYGSRQLRWLQSGQVGAYVLLMVIGILVLFIIQLFL